MTNLELTDRQAILIHTHADVTFQSCIHMGHYLASFRPATFARLFYEEAADWKEIGEQIEREHPDLEPAEWKVG